MKKETNFVSIYYQSGKYKKDYERTLAADLPSIYHVEDNWKNYEKIARKISARYRKWKQGITGETDADENEADAS
ncbi:MAG: hypothetical protein KatS3mg028_1175 [Bacteroidia bacterium]|nr:MAG: hypothetical protein KatS3mg028_1175 [Bacteroidia bacterium]